MQELFSSAKINPPKDKEIVDTPTSIIWKESDQLLVSISKPVLNTVEMTKTAVDLIKEKFGEKKYFYLIFIDLAKPTDKPVRDYASEVLPELVSGMAIVGTKPLARVVVNLFFGLKPPSYPTKMFNSEEKAREWLNQKLVSND